MLPIDIPDRNAAIRDLYRRRYKEFWPLLSRDQLVRMVAEELDLTKYEVRYIVTTPIGRQVSQ